MPSVWRDQRTKGRPVWCIKYKGLDERWHRERTDAQTKEQALRLLRTRLSKLAEAKDKGLLTLETQKPQTFEEFVEKEYLVAQAPPARRESSHERDKQLYRNVKATFGPLLLRAITIGTIEKYFAKRKTEKTCRKTPPSKAQMNRERQFLSSVLGMAKRWGMIDRNVAEDVKKLREDNAQDRVLTLEEETRILGASADYLARIIRLALYTGMRLGEILALKWSDVERRKGEVVLGGFIRIGSESKGHRARHVPINRGVLEVLGEIKPVETKHGFVPFVFVSNRTTKQYLVTSVSLAFAAAARRAGVEGVTFHTLRHTAVSRMVAAGIPDRIIMKIVGHTTPNMVSRYAHLAPDNLKGATDCLVSKPGTAITGRG